MLLRHPVSYGITTSDIVILKNLAISTLTRVRLNISWKDLSVIIFLPSLFLNFLLKDFDIESYAAIFKLDGMG